MIKSVEIRNFKSIRHQSIPLEPITIFVGANASGKTSILQVIDLSLRAANQMGGGADIWEKADWYYSKSGDGDLLATVETSHGKFHVGAERPEHYPYPRLEQYGNKSWKGIRELHDEGVGFSSLAKAAGVSFLLNFDTEELAKPTYSDQSYPELQPNGGMLSSVLAFMALNDHQRFDIIVDRLRGFIPHLESIRFTKSPVHGQETEIVKFGSDVVERVVKHKFMGDAILFDFKNASNVFADMVSEGTLILLGILTVLSLDSKPNVILIDDIDRGLHPLAQRQLIQFLFRLQEEDKELQIIGTSHSPYLLDELGPEQVRALTVTKDGESVCRPLTDLPDFDKWKEEMAPGELWSLFGEKWVADGATV